MHGFDIPLTEVRAFDNARIRAAMMLEGSGVELITVRSNIRSLHENWYEAFGLGLASCFALVTPGYGIGLIGSCDTYDTVDFLIGSNPVTDQLLSTGDMDVRHDGAGMSRTEKVAYLANWEQGMPLLRVCWEGRVEDGNCGRCEKCVRTRLIFLLAGIPSPPCFPVTRGPHRRIWVRSKSALGGWVWIRDQGRLAGQREVVAVTTEVIRRSRPLVAVYESPPLHAVARKAKNAIDRMRGRTRPELNHG